MPVTFYVTFFLHITCETRHIHCTLDFYSPLNPRFHLWFLARFLAVNYRHLWIMRHTDDSLPVWHDTLPKCFICIVCNPCTIWTLCTQLEKINILFLKIITIVASKFWKMDRPIEEKCSFQQSVYTKFFVLMTNFTFLRNCCLIL